MGSDFDDRRPRYACVADDLRAAISGGNYAIGDRLPSGRELADRYEISHMTVKQALGVLRTEGLIASHQGVGVFVRRKPPAVLPSGSATAFDALDARIEALEARVRQVESHVFQPSPDGRAAP